MAESVVVPHRDLHAGLSEVLGPEAVVHHGVVKHGVGRPLHHPRLLSALPAGVRKDGAAVDDRYGRPWPL